ncbi:DUF1772 domain-containing protein [Candidimonas sp. SYP-B2681]|uniref:DUF1772 domain-containing protein n=1 Tax=Candidimonas sp. SYP-B2681 TaxID=2497686 RepID=UPI0018F75901|nr:DUF1772 domain-containing protein [Candidimonas sp. SYP-B2681]
MPMRLAQFCTLLLFAIALVPEGAHVLELANKISLERDAYMTVQQIYRGWDLMGAEMIAALLAGLLLSFLSRREKAPFRLALAGSVLLAASLAIFFLWTFPANAATSNWSIAPENWMALREQWEYSRAAGGAFVLAAFCCITSSCLAYIPANRHPSAGAL